DDLTIVFDDLHPSSDDLTIVFDDLHPSSDDLTIVFDHLHPSSDDLTIVFDDLHPSSDDHQSVFDSSRIAFPGLLTVLSDLAEEGTRWVKQRNPLLPRWMRGPS
ncbi:MAG: hypothetical protein JXR52_04075, partial [Bacteroidales bacterium]|nr:hypothetical protein [Bacteroidales bacterium]